MATHDHDLEGDCAFCKAETESSRLGPRVWIGCLGCYNGGRSVGEWFDAIDCPTDEPEWQLQVLIMRGGSIPADHFAESHEELWVFDHENFGGLLKGECSPMEAQRIAQWMDDHDDIDLGAFGAFREDAWMHENDLDVVAEAFGNAFVGIYESEKDFAYAEADERGFEPSDTWPASCVDWEQATRELFMQDFASAPAPGCRIYVWRNL